MNILVIGNGFDLAHGLPTTYMDFLKFMKIIKEISLEEDIAPKVDVEIFKQIYPEKVIHEQVLSYLNSPDVLEINKRPKEITEIIQLSQHNIWLEYFWQNNEHENKGWIDFESEISSVVQSLDYLRKNYEKTDQETVRKGDIQNCIIDLLPKGLEINSLNIRILNKDEYKKKIIDVLVNDLNNLIRCLEVYLYKIIDKMQIMVKLPDIVDLHIDKILSFNYTHTFNSIYTQANNEIECDFIHGEAAPKNTKDNNMVLGIDEYLVGEAKDKEIDFIEFKKFFQRIHKETGCSYKKWLYKMNQEYACLPEAIKIAQGDGCCNNIYIFGHSLDVTDKDILRDLILNKGTLTTIYYHDKNAYKERITNLVKVIGQDELIARVSGPDKTIIFKLQQPTVQI